MINLFGTDVIENIGDLPRVRQIAIVQEKPRVPYVRVLIEMVDPLSVERAGSTDDPVNLISFFQEKLGKVGSVLPRNPRDESSFHR
jgi:hypothetical protein